MREKTLPHCHMPKPEIDFQFQWIDVWSNRTDKMWKKGNKQANKRPTKKTDDKKEVEKKLHGYLLCVCAERNRFADYVLTNLLIM